MRLGMWRRVWIGQKCVLQFKIKEIWLFQGTPLEFFAYLVVIEQVRRSFCMEDETSGTWEVFWWGRWKRTKQVMRKLSRFCAPDQGYLYLFFLDWPMARVIFIYLFFWVKGPCFFWVQAHVLIFFGVKHGFVRAIWALFRANSHLSRSRPG